MKSILLFLTVVVLSMNLDAQVRISSVDPTNNEVTLHNFGGAAEDVSGHWLCNFPAYSEISTLTVVSGSTNIMPGMSVTVSWGSASGADGEIGYYHTGGAFANSANMSDYMQWGTAGHTRESVADAAGVWTIGEFVVGIDPYNFTGGAFDYGAAFWASSLPTVTFSVDMSQYVPAFGYVNVSGSWNGWCGDCNQMTDMGGGIWEVSLPIPAGDYDYKFTIDNWTDQEALASGAGHPCTKLNGGFVNRNIIISGNETLPTVCFNSCFQCLTGAAVGCTDAAANNYDPVAVENDGTCEYDVTMRVDMTNEVGNFTTPEMNSSFNGWCGGCQTMTDEGGNIWGITFPVQAGSYEYKFAADVWNTQEDLTGETTCATENGGNWNRYLSVGGDTDQGTVCWGDCGACPVGTPGCTNPNANNYDPLATLEDGSCLYNLDLSVDMNCHCGPFTTVYVTGPFNGWCGNCNPLADGDADGIWTATIVVGEGSFEYKYEVDDWADQENLIDDMVAGGSCAPITDFFSFANREVIISDPASTTDTYDTCDACNAPSNALLCDLLVDAVTIDGFDPNTFTYNVVLPFGTVVVPTVTAQTQVAGASHIVTDAVALPGTATVDVTSMDAGTMNTYTINFTVNANSSDYCETYVQHLDIPAETASGMYLTISNIDANTMIVEIESADGDPVDFLLVTGAAGATISPEDFSVPGKISRTLYWDTPPTDVAMNVLWSKASFGGNWQLSGGDIIQPFAAFCVFPDPNVTFSVNMTDYVPAFTQVYVSGEFNGWSGNANPMTDMGGGIWEVTLPIPAGDYRYKYTLDDWAADEVLATGAGWPCTDLNGGFVNRIMTVAGDMTLPTVCWESCQDCLTGAAAGCTDPAANNYDPLAVEANGTCEYDVTMRVDMLYVTDPFTTPELNGSFNGWCGNCQPMILDAGTVWMINFPVVEGSWEFKFAADNWNIQENFLPDADPCTVSNGGFTNRFMSVTGDLDLGTVCWESCEECPPQPAGCTNPNANNYDAGAVLDDGSCLYDVTFNVDMNCHPDPYTTVHITGPFCGWCGGGFDLADPELDGIWTGTFEFLEGDLEFKYMVDGFAAQEDLVDDMVGGASCAPVTDFATYANRLITINDPIVTNDAYGSCDPCAPVVPIDVTFYVDMTNETVSPNGVHLMGSFQGNDPSSTPMTNVAYGIYSVTVTIDGNTLHTYRFVNGDMIGDAEAVAGACTNGTDREVTTGSVNMSLPIVCFASCDACGGCTDPLFIEYNPFAGTDDGSCSNLLVEGCTYTDADNFNPLANVDDGSCVFTLVDPCPFDTDGNGLIDTLDLLNFLGVFGTVCP